MKIIAKLRKSVFTRIMLIFLVAMIPIVSISYYACFYGSNLTNKEISASLQTKSKYLIETMEQEVERINYQLYNLMADKDLNSLADLPQTNQYEHYMAAQRLTQRITTIKDGSTFLKDLIVRIEPFGYNISVANGMSSIDLEQYDVLWHTQKNTGSGIVLSGNEYRIILSPLLYDNNQTTRPLFIIDAIISKDAITSLIEMSAKESNSDICFTNGDKKMLFYYGKAEISIFDDYISKLDKKDYSEENKVEFSNILERNVNVSYEYSEYFDMALIQIVTDNIYIESLRIYRWILVLMTVLTLLMICLFTALIYMSIQKPIVSLLQAIDKVEKGDFHSRIDYYSNNELQHLINGFNHMLDSLNDQIEKVYNQEILTKRAELKQLQTQIDPHFLFNSFFMLKTMLKCDRLKEADQFIQYLGDYYQYVTRNESDYALLRDEIEHAKAYSNIQMMRFKRSFVICFDQEEKEIGNIRVPRMILQPFIENIIEHGIKGNRHKTEVRVTFEKQENTVSVRISDTGGELDANKIDSYNRILEGNGNISAVVNIHRRLQIMYGEKSGIHFEPNGSEGLMVVVTMVIDPDKP